VHYRSSADKAKATVDAIRAAGGRAAAVKADLANRTQRRGLIARATNPFGPLTLLVNNASAFEKDAATDLDEALWDIHFAIHVEAPAFLARDFAAQLPEGVTGNIVNIIDSRVLHLTLPASASTRSARARRSPRPASPTQNSASRRPRRRSVVPPVRTRSATPCSIS
jgi:NAD(P)-dependent dehydrogenase (short-subunit alcohol dehydrogenase family)